MLPRTLAAAALLLAVTLPLQSRPAVVRAARIAPRLATLPRVTVWVWQRREDLHTLNPRTTAVAALDRTLTLTGPTLTANLQRNALTLPAGIPQLTVVRLQTEYPDLTPASAQATARAILAAVTPTSAALQLDFDATRSERPWYRLLLADLRAGLPPQLPLSITALASWCSSDRWLAGLPIDEAVPMLFRLEPGTHLAPHTPIPLREPLCQTSLGLSTTEPWPDDRAGKRLYLFPDHGWHHDDPTSTLAAAAQP